MNPTTSTTRDSDAGAVLAAIRQARAEANAAEARVLAHALEWAHLHVVDTLDDACTLVTGNGRDTGIPIAGQGAPLVSEFAVWELAAALGLSAESGRNLVAQALELAHRLPKVWARVQEGSLAPWRAKRIADATLHLNLEAAGFVDVQVAPFAHKTGPTQTQRLVDEAIARFMPELAAEQRDRACEQRYFSIDHDQVSFAGTSRVHGELDLADALDLDDAVRRGAEQLAALGNTESLDVRRSLAVGMLARGERAIEFGTADGVVSAGSTTQGAGSTTRLGGSTTQSSRNVVLYVHLSEEALRSGDRDAPAWVENAGGQLVTTGQVAEWCGVSAGSTTGNGSTTRNGSTTGSTKITVRPVLDLAATVQSTGYQPSATLIELVELVELRDRTCVFPWCQRPARSRDKDHIIRWEDGGPTSSTNLACLCRKHHRMKTHGGWSYTMLTPGTYLWHSPHGQTWRRDRTGTTDLTPPTQPNPVEPPDQ